MTYILYCLVQALLLKKYYSLDYFNLIIFAPIITLVTLISLVLWVYNFTPSDK